MKTAVSTSLTRRNVVAVLAAAAASTAILAAGDARAQTKQSSADKSLYERLGGVFAIAAVVDHFSDAVVKNPIVGQKSKNPQLRKWHTKNLERLPGLKFMRTLWVCDVSRRPLQVRGHQAGRDAARPRGGPSGLEDFSRGIRRGRGGTRADARPL
ncbi:MULTISPECIES: group 1 truncated hemoglobin [unclassified Mesorhizobium]|uniref:group 1 truncated hemoglobin n=1 Tax=unclassified Mesorhizobium TaxID=325217 RepID=UPI001FDED203|nr:MULTISPECIES: group 1 truncated hemoglobin [unclassified Mesorhizobium]